MLSDDELYALAGGLDTYNDQERLDTGDTDLDEEIDALARRVEVQIQRFEEEIFHMNDYPIGQRARSELIEVDELV